MEKKLDTFIKIIQGVKPYLAEYYHVSDIALFGSYVKGEEKPDSDLDVLVSFDVTPDLISLASLSIFLEDKLGIKVDLVPNQNIRPRIAQHIIAEKLEIY